MRKGSWFLALGVGWIAAAGCGGSTGDGSSSATPVPADQFVSAFVDAVCDNLGPCCQKSGLKYDAAGCKAVGMEEFASDFKPDLPNTLYDAAAAGKCVAAVKNAATTCSDFDGIDELCSRILKGTLPEGATCTEDEECAAPANGRADCDYAIDAQNGKCVVQARGKLGEGCSDTCTESASSISCSGGSGGASSSGNATCYTNDGVYCDGTCTPVIPLGGACEYEGCVTGAFCNQGKCAAIPGAGSACANGYDCAEGHYCDEKQICQKQKALGQPCASSDECSTNECDGTTCVVESPVSTEICDGTKS